MELLSGGCRRGGAWGGGGEDKRVGCMCGGEGIITRRQTRPGLPAVKLFSWTVTTAIDIPSR